MSVDINQVRYLFKRALQNDPRVSSLCGNRIFPQHFQTLDGQPPEMPLVVFASLGGDTAYFGGMSTLQFEVFCYSTKNASAAYALSHAVYDALQETRLGDDGVTARGVSRQLTGGTEDYNESMDAYYIRSTYEVKVVS